MSGEIKPEKIRINGECQDAAREQPPEGGNNVSNYTDVLPSNGINHNTKQQGVVRRGKKTLARGKSFNQEDTLEMNNSDTSQESFPLNEGCVFPSPVPITEEEAMRETSCHFIRQGHRHIMSGGGSFDDGGNDPRFSATNGHHLADSSEVQGHSGYISARSALRREAEKPPRLQKQSSRERLPGNNRTGYVDGNTNGNNAANQPNEPTTECLDSMGVDVHEFIVKALQSNPRDRTILIKLERDMTDFIEDKSIEFMKFPDMTSYHRMLVHRVAAYFGMDHNIDAKGKAVIINKTRNTRRPEKKFSEYVAEVDEQAGREDDMCRRSILKRMKNCQSLEHTQMPMKSAKDWSDAKQRSFEEREVDYEKIRARIFSTKEAMGNGEKRSKAKERIMSQWSRKPWNSTDLESLPGRGRSTPPVSILGSSSLTSKSNSYSGITVLSRRNNNTKDCISSSSSSSSIYPNPISEQAPTDNANDEYEPLSTNPPTIYPYYPESCNDTDDETSSRTTKKSVMHETACHVINISKKQLIIAVPAGFNVEPGTLLTHPHTGVPYVNMEGQPILFPSRSVPVPSYSSMPMQYNPKYGTQPHLSSIAPGASVMQPSPQENNGSTENGVPSNGIPRANPPNNDGGENIYQPSLNPYAYQYQHAPVHFVYYQSPQAQGQPAPPGKVLDPSHMQHCSNVGDAMSSLHIQEKDTNVTNVASLNQEVTADPLTTNGTPCINAQNCSLSSDDTLTTRTPPQADDGPKASASQSQDAHNATDANDDALENSSNDDSTPQGVTSGSSQHPSSNGVDMHPGNVPPTPPEGVIYYPPHEPQAPLPLQPGLTGQPVFTHPPTRHIQPHMYPGGMIPYPMNGVSGDRKLGRHVVNPQGVTMEQQEYYIHPVPQHVHPGYGGYFPNPSAPVYYMVNNQGFAPYQTAPNQVVPNMPLMYPSLPNGYNPHTVPQSPAYRPPYQYEASPSNGVGDLTLPEPDGGENGSPVDGQHPLYVNGAASGIDSPELIAFAARNEAKLVQVASSDDCDKDSPTVKDVYLLFPSSSVAFRALEDHQSCNFRLTDLPDSKQRRELLDQIKTAAM